MGTHWELGERNENLMGTLKWNVVGTHWEPGEKIPPLPRPPNLKGKKARHLECMLGPSHWLHEISLPKRVRHLFWPGLIPLAKNTLPGLYLCTLFIGPCPPQGQGLYSVGSNFWKFYLIRTGFTLGEPVSLVKVFRLFRLEQIVLVLRM
jgi:hypothetical protein